MPAVDTSLNGVRDLDWMRHDIDFSNPREKRAKFLHAVMPDGLIDAAACAAAELVS